MGMRKAKKVIVIGSGFAGLSAAASLAKEGMEVLVLEKNTTLGGRARLFEEDGFSFDMGPSWYWMPDVFESYFEHFGKKASDFYDLVRLDPSYRVFFGKDEVVDLPASMEGLGALFENMEPGAGKQLVDFMKEAAYKYDVGIRDLVYKPGRSLWEFADMRVMKGIFRLHLFRSFARHVRHFFKHPHLISLMEFPVLFLGAKPSETPALYSLMNYADMQLGTWYPMGGMHKIVEAMVKVAEGEGVKFKVDAEVAEIVIENGLARAVALKDGSIVEADLIVAGADYHHVEQKLLPLALRTYSPEYWEKRTMAPSSLIFYLGIGKRLEGLEHHNLFFDTDFGLHAREIYDHPQWPSNPLFYVCMPSKTDSSVAPTGSENLFILIPVAPGLEDKAELHKHYYELVMDRLEALTGQEIRPHVVFQRSYGHNNFIADYHAFKGNAYGLANTLRQTAILKPSIKSKKVKNLYYTGQLTVPGPGVPPSIISGRVVAKEIIKDTNHRITA
jgi:phytoene desaturase